MKSTLLISIFIANILMLFCQAPAKFSFQAELRNTSGDLISSQSVGVKISLIEGNLNGTVVFEEIHTVLTTENGRFHLIIGDGIQVGSGSMSNINFGSNEYYVKVSLDENGGNNYADISKTRLLSVPYALYANSSGSGGSDSLVLTFNNTTGELSSSIGNSVFLPLTTGGDNWGSQTIVTDTTLQGDGSSANPLTVNTTNIDNQNLSSYDSGTNRTINISNGTGTTFNVEDNDNSSTNEIQTLSISGSSLSLSNGGGTITLPNSSNSSVVQVVDNSNYNSIPNIVIGSIVNIQGTINLSSNYTKFQDDQLNISGGEIAGTGTQEIDFGKKNTIVGVEFNNVIIDAHAETVFFNCEFNNCVLEGGQFLNSELNYCENSSGSEVNRIENCEISNCSIERLGSLTNSVIRNSTTIGSSTKQCTHVVGNEINDCMIYSREVFSNNNISDSKIITDGGDRVSITGNTFDDPYSGEDEIILVNVDGSSASHVNITGNTFEGQSSLEQFILITGNYSGSQEGLVFINNNLFNKAERAISSSTSSINMVLTNNTHTNLSINFTSITSNLSSRVLRDNDGF